MQQDPEQITYFAHTNARGKELPFGIKRKDRARHMYIIGKTGMGKSTLLENMAIQDIRNGEGMAFIDPHGSTADRIMEYVPEHRIKDVIYFAPFDMDYPVAFNVMEDVGYDKRHLVVSGLLSAFRKIWVDAWSARMEYILSNTLLALLEFPGATLLDVNRMLINKNFRKKVVDNVKDPLVKSFWVDEFANYTDRYTQDATPAIQNKVGQFTSNPLIRNIVGQPKSSFDIRELMDQKKILIMNLSKGRVGEVNATLLGSMLVTKIYLAAMSRADVTADSLQSLPQFYFYVDEFQNFANQSFADILSEARKYKLNLIIAHQYIEQMEEEVRDAVFGNVGTTVAFRVGPFDAEVLETIFNPQFTATDLVNLGFAQIYLTLMIDGVGSPPFSATTMKPFDPPPGRFVTQVLENSRAIYGRSRPEVEAAIDAWNQSDPFVSEAPKPKKPTYSKSAEPKRPVAAPAVAEPPYVRVESPKAVAHTDPGALKSAIAHAHAVATSRAKEPPPQTLATDTTPAFRPTKPVARKPFEPRPAPVKPTLQPEKPPLDGAKSLREALQAATGKKLPGHAPDLKATLGKIVPPPPANPHPQSTPQAASTPLPQAAKPVPEQFTPLKKQEIPEAVLRDMLSVDEPYTES